MEIFLRLLQSDRPRLDDEFSARDQIQLISPFSPRGTRFTSTSSSPFERDDLLLPVLLRLPLLLARRVMS